MKKKVLFICAGIMIIFVLLSLMYFLPLKKTYKTELNYNIEVPLFSKIEEKLDTIVGNDDNTTITIISYQSSKSINIINKFIKDFTKYEKEDGTIYYYNPKEDYSIRFDNIKKGITQIIELSVIKGNKYERIIEDHKFYEFNTYNHLNNVMIKEDNSGLVNVYDNKYKYNLSTMWVSDSPNGYDHNFHYTLEDIFKYNHYKIEDFIKYYDEAVEYNYGKKIIEDNYTLYTPVEERTFGKVHYSILICNNKYIFGSKDLKYNKDLCN